MHHAQRAVVIAVIGFLCVHRPAVASPVVGRPVTDPAHPGSRITLELDKPTYFLGENIVVNFHVENTSDAPFTIDFGGDNEGADRPRRFHVTATDPAGVAAPDPTPNQPCLGGIGASPTITKDHDYWLTVPLMRYCRIDRPGSYVIRVSHDLGWRGRYTEILNKPGPDGPEASIVITLKMPTTKEAEQVVSEMDTLSHTSGVFSQPRTSYPDFSCLRYPIYLPILMQRARGADIGRFDNFVHGISSIPTTDATRALVRLMGDRSVERAAFAAQAIRPRLPEPNPVQTGPQQYGAATWAPECTPDVRRAALRLIDSHDPNAIANGGLVLEAVANAKDLHAVIAALDRILAPTVDNKSAHDAGRGLIGTIARCLALGATVPQRPESLGQRLVYVVMINTAPAGRRPTDWTSVLDRVFAAPSPALRSLTMEVLQVRAMSEPAIAKAAVPYLPELLASNDNYVYTYASFWAGMAPDPALKPAILTALNAHPDLATFLVGDADRCGGRWDAAYQLADNMHDTPTVQSAYTAFTRLIAAPSYGMDANLDAGTIADLRTKWLAFLTTHRDEVLHGATFSKDAMDVKDLFPGGLITF